MTRRTIVLILVVTALIALIAFTTLKKETSIEKVFLSDNYISSSDTESIAIEELGEFANSSEIYAIILLKNIKVDDSINVRWTRIEDSVESLVQEDTVIEKQEGSGPLIISLVKKNNRHDTGVYKIYVKLNESEAIEKSFTVR